MSAHPFGDEAWRWETGAMRRDLEGAALVRDPVPPSVPRRTRDTTPSTPPAAATQPTETLAAWLKAKSIGGVPNGVVVGGLVVGSFLAGLLVGRR